METFFIATDPCIRQRVFAKPSEDSLQKNNSLSAVWRLLSYPILSANTSNSEKKKNVEHQDGQQAAICAYTIAIVQESAGMLGLQVGRGRQNG